MLRIYTLIFVLVLPISQVGYGQAKSGLGQNPTKENKASKGTADSRGFALILTNDIRKPQSAANGQKKSRGLLSIEMKNSNRIQTIQIQAALNQRLANRLIPLKGEPHLSKKWGRSDSEKDQVRELTLSSGSKLLLRGDAELVETDSRSSEEKAWSLQLGDEPLKVDGIYAEKTYAAVYLFQVLDNLPNPSGEVDAVTLDRLEPLIPPNHLLATILGWVHSSQGEGPLVGDPWWAKQCASLITVFVILILTIIVHLTARNFATSTAFLSKWVFTPTSSPWFTSLKDQRFFRRMAHFAPAVFIFFSANLFPPPIPASDDPFPYLAVFEDWHDALERIGLAYCGLVCMSVGLAFVDAARVVYTSKQSEDNPIDGIIGFAKRFVVVVGFVLICAGLAKRNPMFFVGGLGAFMAVIMLVFKDTILGLAASVQIIGHDMVKVGDWIEMPKYGVDGYVTAMSLTTIKVQNFDKTIASIPTQAVLTDSFKNWRGMQESGGRRIKRSILIDMNTVQPCDAEMCDRFENIDLLRDYIKLKREELKDHLLENDVTISPVNGRWLTNIGTFRIYVEAYLRWHPQINAELTCLVRHLPLQAEGLPIEIYCFCTETSLSAFEKVQADVFDHLMSVLPEFDLRVFQNPREFDYESVEARYKHRIDNGAFAVAEGFAAPTRINELRMFVAQQNKYLASNSRARVDTAVRKVQDEIDRDGLDSTVRIQVNNRRLTLDRD